MSYNDAREAWLRPYTIADVAFVEALPPDQRAIVERYARMRTHGVPASLVPPDIAPVDEYERGWSDAMDAAESELHMVSLPGCPSPKERERRSQRRRSA